MHLNLRGGPPTSNGGLETTSISLQRSSTVDETRKRKRKSLRHSLKLPLFSQTTASATSTTSRSSPIKEDTGEAGCAKEQNLPLLNGNDALECDV